MDFLSTALINCLFVFQMQVACCRDGYNICYKFYKWRISPLAQFTKFNEKLPEQTKTCQLITQ